MTKKILKQLVQEVVNGEHVMDTLPNDAWDFSGERQAAYFSNARRFMQSDVFHSIVYSNQQTDDVKFLQEV